MLKKIFLPFLLGILFSVLFCISYYFYFIYCVFNEIENIGKTHIFSENTNIIGNNLKKEKISFQTPNISIFRFENNIATQKEFESILELNKKLKNKLKIYFVLKNINKNSFYEKYKLYIFQQDETKNISDYTYFVANKNIYYSTPQIFDWNTEIAKNFIQKFLYEKNN